MTAAIADLVQETTSGTGTSDLTLTAVNGRRTFNTAFGNGVTTNVFFYFIMHRTAAEWEMGLGHMSDATTLVRDTVVLSSNANAAVNFSVGTKDVCCDQPATWQTDPWAHQPLGVPIGVYTSLWGTLFDALPPLDRYYRYILLTAGEDGTGEYNEGVVDGESLSGSAPLVLATANINFAASPIDNATVRLINTERRFLRAGSVGTVENDQMQQITGTFGDWQRNTAIGTGAFTHVGLSNVARGGATSVAFSGSSFDSADSSGARTGNETRGKNLGLNFVMRIY